MEGDPALTESTEEYRNTRLHFYYNLPAKATWTTFFYTDALAAPLLLEDPSNRNMEAVRKAKKVTKRKRLESYDTCKRR